jgi:Cu(I)/Ag(I) efflux system membrane fusion protein
MTLEPIPQGGPHAAQAGPGGEGDVPGLSSVHITPDRIQLIGVRTARVERRPLGGRLELVGFVTPDEARLKRVQLRVSGWVEQLYVSRTGQTVAAGEPLLSIYSPELFQSEQEYLIERAAHDTLDAAAAPVARERLRLLGVPEEEIRRLDRERTAATRLTLRSPVAGTVLERGVTEGQYVAADTPLFGVADLSHVWVLGDLYEMDFTRVHPGDRARFTADALPNEPFEGVVDFVYPTVSSETRTLKVRLGIANARQLLRPGMYGRLVVVRPAAPTLAVPTEAVVNTGQRDYVFLAHAGGHFEPRLVRLGLEDGDWAQVLSGLAVGDTVVASASFLIDSESRLKAAIAGMGEPPASGHVHQGMPGMEDAP